MNAVIFEKASKEIKYFIKDAIKKGNDFEGSNLKISGVKPLTFGFFWTEDTTEPIIDSDGQNAFIAGYDKTVSDMTVSSTGPEINQNNSASEYSDAVLKRKELADLTYKQVENYINANVTDLASARQYLIKLSKVVLAIIKMMDGKN